MFNFGFNLDKSSSQSRESWNRGERVDTSFTAGNWDTVPSLRRLDNTLGSFDFDAMLFDSNQQARVDTQGAITNIFNQFRESALPEIFSGMNSSGAYNSTSSQLMSNDAFSRATNQAAELELGVASSYIGQRMSNREMLMNQFAQLLQANLQSTGTNETQSNASGMGLGTQRGTAYGVNVGYGGGGGGGIGSFTGGG